MQKKTYSIAQAAKMLNVHEDTLRNWEEEGLITPLRVGKRLDRKYTDEIISDVVKRGLATPYQDLSKDIEEKKLTLAQLETFLWKSADILRGKIDSSDYKKYIFGLLFYKRMSDVWDEEYASVMKEYNDEDIARADYNHRFQVPKDARWEKITQQAENIGQKLNDIFEALANANSPKLDKIFDDLDFANKDRFPNETLQRLINHFSQYNFGNTYISSDLLGDAYEYLIKQFAADAGKKGGEFYTPREVEKVIIGILKPHKKDHIYDPTVGSGGFLLEAYDYLKAKSGEKIAKTLYLYGQELNLATFAIAKINMFLHGLDSADIRRGDTLVNPQFLNQQGGLQTFDIVVANPPYSIKDYEWEMFKNKFGRLDGYDAPPEKNADFAFVLHIIKSMNANGRAGIVLPNGVLSRVGAEARIREQILRNDLIEAIVALPSKLFYGTGIPAVVLILNKNKSDEKKGKVIIIDAEKDFFKGKNQNSLRPQDISKIIKAYDNYEDIEKYARVIALQEIEANDFNLNISQYIDSTEKEEAVHVQQSWMEIERLEKELTSLNREIEKSIEYLNKRNAGKKLKDTKLGWIPEDWEIVELYEVRNKDDRYSFAGGPFGSDLKRSDYTEEGVRILQLQNIGDGEFLDKYKIYTSAEKAESLSKCLIYPGDILIAKMADPVARACIVPQKDKSYLMASDGIRLSPDLKEYDVAYLKYAINSKYFRAMAIANSTGSTRLRIGLDRLKQLPIIKPPKSEQIEIGNLLTNIDAKRYLANEIEQELVKLKKGIAQDLLSGKVRK